MIEVSLDNSATLSVGIFRYDICLEFALSVDAVTADRCEIISDSDSTEVSLVRSLTSPLLPMSELDISSEVEEAVDMM